MLTNLDFLSVGQKWQPESEQERMLKYAQNKDLFEGNHENIYTRWATLYEGDNTALLVVANWHKRLSTLWADLLLGEEPEIYLADQESAENVELKRMVHDNNLLNTAYEVVLDISRYGTGLFKIRYDGSGIIEPQPPTVWYPVVDPANIKSITAHVLAWTYEVTEKTLLGVKKVQKLRCEIHEKGLITYRTYTLKDDVIGKLDEEVKQLTGVDRFLVVPVNNLTTSDTVIGADDYVDIDGLVQEIEIRLSQISRILDKHSDPNLYGDSSALERDERTGEWVFKGGGKFFPIGDGALKPGYITWDGHLDAAFKQIDALMEQLYFVSNTSPAAFGQVKSGLAESGSALRRLLMSPLSKVNRIRLRLDPVLKNVISLCSELEVAQSHPQSKLISNIDISINWYDGLPQDNDEQVKIEAKRVVSGISSIESAVRRLDGLSGEDLQEEVLRVKQDYTDKQSKVLA